MRIRVLLLFSVLLLISACKPRNGSGTEIKSAVQPHVSLSPDTVPRVTGIGGIFFVSDDPKALEEWYGKNLGMTIGDYGSTFEFRNAYRPDEINYLQWSLFKKNTKYFKPSKKEFMINYRVNNLGGLLRKLKENGVVILDSVETYDYGKFIHIMDSDGNKIELWEPVDSILTNFGGKTTK
jgi:predicted enzyme related to lactoylglutathione lyase